MIDKHNISRSHQSTFYVSADILSLFPHSVIDYHGQNGAQNNSSLNIMQSDENHIYQSR
jgi:hypothetical protein